ncbi:aminoglycoside 6'-N-acetyltransferase I [Bosea sp. CRIB-10]|uniref:aminoglycoside 6'-N-acetyltransferase n=1 Tax=Bosea sp. CRIB-10 TaxID=378404 RepID=UPI0008DEFE27|nr:aminoglycoside 6'-N-acetyltransferase [Bosea sp. CRIB-10]SFC90838.1 aminoglycoside 6'-N-acetyltransferase I [Bosea sp. CRIB-10]
MTIEPRTEAVLEDWLELRRSLWPEPSAGSHRVDIRDLLDRSDSVAFLARDDDGRAIGLAEAALRHDYVNGCETSPVGFLEGIYVVSDQRSRGVARALCAAVEAWARASGCSELASDTGLTNTASQRAHAAMGFEETERVIYYRKRLRKAWR